MSMRTSNKRNNNNRTTTSSNSKKKTFPLLTYTVESRDLDNFIKSVYKTDCPYNWRTTTAECTLKGVVKLEVRRGTMTDSEKNILRDFKTSKSVYSLPFTGVLRTVMHDLANMRAIPEGTYFVRL